MNVGGKLSPPIHPNRNGWKPTEEKLTEHLSDDEKGKLILLLCKLLNLSDQEV